MSRNLLIYCMLLLVATGWQEGIASEELPDYRTVEQCEKRIAEIESKLAEETPSPNPTGMYRQGFRSGYLEPRFDENEDGSFVRLDDEEVSIVIDLFAVRAFDQIALVPAHSFERRASDGERTYVEGFGFPVRYKIETADELDGPTDSLTWNHYQPCDENGQPDESDQPNPGAAPVLFGPKPVTARYIRFTSTKHYETDEHRLVVALSELMVFNNGESLAVNARVKTDVDTMANEGWGDYGIVDGATNLGVSADSRQTSPTDGYHSKITSTHDRWKWVQVDLGEPVDIRWLNVYPAFHVDNKQRSHMFPVRMIVDLCNDPEFPAGKVVRSEYAEREAFQPGSNPVCFRVDGWSDEPMRYLRINAIELQEVEIDEVNSEYSFAIGEVEVIGTDGENHALNKPVTSSDGGLEGEGPRWSEAALTDGFVSHGKLMPIIKWIELHAERGALLVEQELLQKRVDSTNFERRQWVSKAQWWLVAVIAAVSAIYVFRNWGSSKRRIGQLRKQIARDLHDEIGSSLAMIRISSELLADRDDVGEDVVRELDHIRDTAIAAGDSMRDIVWLVDAERASSAEMVGHLRQLVEAMLPNTHVKVSEQQTWHTNSVPLEVRRGAVLAFKETLTNTRKHARAENVVVEFVVAQREFSFRVTDDGCGIDDDIVEAARLRRHLDDSDFSSLDVRQFGLRNLFVRAEESGGICTITKRDEGGTEVYWSAKMT